LVVTPYYNRPPDRGVVDYYEKVAACSPLDIIAYNIPSRTGKNMSVELIARLAEIPSLRGVKEGAGDIAQMADLVHRFMGTDFAILTGEDMLLLECCCLGGDGGIMAAAAVIPAELNELYTLLSKGELAAAQALNKKLRPLVKGLFCESNPIPAKYALHKMFGMSAALRSPMCELDSAKRPFLEALLTDTGIYGEPGV
jgi:4-hydroxy-tetrahydrodipicolinate synthase